MTFNLRTGRVDLDHLTVFASMLINVIMCYYVAVQIGYINGLTSLFDSYLAESKKM